MPLGVVKWFDCKKGFGFVVDAGGRDIFVHYSAIEGDGFRRLKDGDQVEFDLSEGPKGFAATKVRATRPRGRGGILIEQAPR